ncbi:MAG: hypothetical protein IKM39_01560, partial [Clostridia bacterium]|nr:hypothetical protein [Clostridia bacterium]
GCLLFRQRIFFRRNLTPFVALAGLFLLYTFVVYIFNYQSVFYYLWGFRNNFRVYVAFIAYCSFFNEEQVDSFLKLLDGLFWVNAVVTFFQFFVLGYNQDYLGGIFGVERGCNGFSILFFSAVLCKSMLLYMEGKEGTFHCFAKCGVALIIAAMAELKFFFVIFIFILIFSACLTKFSWRKLTLIGIGAGLMMFAGSILAFIFGDVHELSIDRILEWATSSNYASAEDLGRFTAIPTLAETILTDWPSRLFGMGLGNCDYSAFPICNTPFYQAYGDLHYNWFLSAFLFLETGILGLLLNLSFFVTAFVVVFKNFKKDKNSVLYKMTMIIAILCIFVTFYNGTLRREIAYMAYFILALPVICPASQKEQG